MSTVPCRACQHPVEAHWDFCPACRAPRPSLPEWNGVGCEWKSPRSFRGWPLVHIAFGTDREGRLRTARGVIAVGQRAVGGIACGIIATGIVSIGVVAFGGFSLGVVAVAFGAACGVNAVAPVAFGVVAVGAVAGGLQAAGWKVLFSFGR